MQQKECKWIDSIKYQLIHRQAASAQISCKEESAFTRVATICYGINLNMKYSRKRGIEENV